MYMGIPQEYDRAESARGAAQVLALAGFAFADAAERADALGDEELRGAFDACASVLASFAFVANSLADSRYIEAIADTPPSTDTPND